LSGFSGGNIMLDTIIGGFAAFCTTVSYIPQVKKAWQTRQTGDISLKMLLLLATGLGLWVAYGLMKSDWVIVVANSISLAMLANLIWFKMREKKKPGGGSPK
jgi:MtN3 and saliva related transmembrane protein